MTDDTDCPGFFPAMLANAQSNLVLLISAAGDNIGVGQTYYTTSPYRCRSRSSSRR